MNAAYSRYRWTILALLLIVTIINFVDRQTLSILAPKLKEIFGFSNTEYGRIVAAFQLGMTVAEFPMGMLMDRWGVRAGFTFAVLWWSAATAYHAIATSGWAFALGRFWMGTGECGNYSGGVKTVTRWFPREERTFAIGVFNGGSMIGAMIAPPLIVFLNAQFGWRVAFLLPAALGVLWVIAWRVLYRDPGANEAPQMHGTAPSNRELLRHPQTWGLMLCRFLAGPVMQFYWYWMPDYLHAERGMTMAAIGAFSWLPYLIGDAGSLGGGWATRWLLLRGYSIGFARRATLWFGAACCLFSLAVVLAPSAGMALAVISVVLFGHTFLSANMFASVSDFFPEEAAGRVVGLTGLTGGLGGILFPLATGVLVDKFSYAPAFVIAALLPLAGTTVLILLARDWKPARLGA